MKITEEHARKVKNVVAKGLCRGLGKPKPGKMCVEAAVCYAMGEEHNDQPECVHPDVAEEKIVLNDQNWSSKKARAKGLKRVAIAQLGSSSIHPKNYYLFSTIYFNRLQEIATAIDPSNADRIYNLSNFIRLTRKKFRHLDTCLTVAAGALEYALHKIKSPGCKFLYLVE